MTIPGSLATVASRSVVTVGVAAIAALVLAGVASAHVSAHSPDQPAKGGDAEIVFRVPDEAEDAATTKIEVGFPSATPIPGADVEHVPGWTSRVTTAKLAKPVNMGKNTVDTAVQSITWTAEPGTKIGPGEFQEFTVSVEGLPTNADELVMPTIQTYDNGTVVKWDEQAAAGQAEPTHPAPSLALAAERAGTGAMGSEGGASTTATAAPASDSTARWLGVAGVVLGALGLGVALGLLIRRRAVPRTSAA
ncbi:YcnI family protein [Amycolatopsis sp. NBC_00345]|uniref:YcnI family copper-binding membrane protein n=1 Tax=Amycolatopsis sp. NBC_00345 TaxID=2975955 RepID=UPI002E266154